MRIQNNITAMNTHRQYTINNDNVAKAAEKLSSGYRINRAGDDAAGLAISEKMRSQIRGLNMAAKNSQDAISLVQTAEGALQETHSMLQRMNELAVQSATGTNESIDREALAKEFQQLKREINDIAEQTTFNNMKVLDGSLSYSGPVRSAATAGITATVQKDVVGSASAALSGAVTTSSLVEAADADNTGALGGFTASFTLPNSATSLTTGASYGLEITINGEKIQADTTKTVDFAEAATAAKNSPGTLFAGAEFTYKGVTFTLSNSSGAIKIEGADQAELEKIDFKNADIKIGINTIDPQTGASTPYAEGTVSARVDHVNTTAGAAQKNLMTINPDKVQVGDTITIGGKTFEITGPEDADGNAITNNTALANGNTAIVWNGETGDKSDFMTNLDAALGTAGGAAGTVGTASVTKIGENTYTVETANVGVDKAEEAAVTYKAAGASDTEATTANTKTTIEFDTAKMKDGDTFEFEVDGVKATVTYNKAALEAAYKAAKEADPKADPTMANLMANMAKDALVAAGVDADALVAKGNALIVTDKEVGDTKLSWNKEADTSNAIRIQVGALENEQLAVSIDAMNTAGLGLDEHEIDSQNAAGRAITAVRAAINKVSDQRATLGAMQNRLDHKIANLKVSSENLSAAESRIRDVDMASEMTNFTKNNILSQAATAMLAQANALPQNVLSLLG